MVDVIYFILFFWRAVIDIKLNLRAVFIFIFDQSVVPDQDLCAKGDITYEVLQMKKSHLFYCMLE